MTDIFNIPLTTIDGTPTTLAPYRGQVLLIVNVASRCGFTGQYSGLEKLYTQFRERGFVVLGFPCNQFGNQEPGDEGSIKEFCSLTYKVSFPMFAKIEVNGEGTHPLYQELKSRGKGLLGSEAIKWNFTKFLIDRSGSSVVRFAPTTAPESLQSEIEKLLGESPTPS